MLGKLKEIFTLREETGKHGDREPTRHSLDIATTDLAFADLEKANRRFLESAHQHQGHGTPAGGSADLVSDGAEIKVPYETLFEDENGKKCLAAAKDLASVASSIPTARLEAHAPHLVGFDWASYLRINAIRVRELCKYFQSVEFSKGSVLEIGGYFGSFALPLARMGYDVTVIDRYEDYGESLEPFTKMMEQSGATVVKTTATDEEKALAELGEFDCVIAMAVIEHIPHTPRLFLESMKSHLGSGGLMAMDTPNIASYWNRKRLAQGETIFQDIKSQFHSPIPFEGHHREYTGEEMKWMLECIGLEEVMLKYFDYNMFQHEKLEGEHVDCFLRMIEDPTKAGLILATGRKV